MMPHTGDLAADMLAYATQLCIAWHETNMPRLLALLAVESLRDPSMTKLAETCRQDHFDACLERMTQEQERGAVDAESDIRLFLETFWNDLWVRHLFRQEPFKIRELRILVDRSLAGLQP